MSLSVKIDTSFTIPLLQYLSSPSKESLIEITEHAAAKKTHSHAVRFGNTEKNISSFWKEIMKKLSEKKNTIEAVESSLTFISNETDMFNDLLEDLENYFPKGTSQRTNLYTILGYDIGIVSEGNALINLGHQDFIQDPREILFMSMHELHHVVYTEYNPIFELSQIHRTDQLCDIVKYCTHMEGLAVYSTLEKRIIANALYNQDYKLLLDDQAKEKRVSEYFDIFTKLETQDIGPLQENDWEIIDKMSSRDRLWYVTGAHMAQYIDEKLGRDSLNETIQLGPDDFFKKYHDAL